MGVNSNFIIHHTQIKVKSIAKRLKKVYNGDVSVYFSIFYFNERYLSIQKE